MIQPKLHIVHKQEWNPIAEIELAGYRAYTRALLRRYFRIAVDIGRLPSILGGLRYRAKVSNYPLHTFEDAVIFVHDIERVFDRLERRHLEMIAGVSLLEYSIPEAAMRIGITVQRAERRYNSALDSLSAILLETGLLRRLKTPGAEDELPDDPGEQQELAPSLPPRKAPQPDMAAARCACKARIFPGIQ